MNQDTIRDIIVEQYETSLEDFDQISRPYNVEDLDEWLYDSLEQSTLDVPIDYTDIISDGIKQALLLFLIDMYIHHYLKDELDNADAILLAMNEYNPENFSDIRLFLWHSLQDLNRTDKNRPYVHDYQYLETTIPPTRLNELIRELIKTPRELIDYLTAHARWLGSYLAMNDRRQGSGSLIENHIVTLDELIKSIVRRLNHTELGRIGREDVTGSLPDSEPYSWYINALRSAYEQFYND